MNEVAASEQSGAATFSFVCDVNVSAYVDVFAARLMSP
jgi:hypothetical protein